MELYYAVEELAALPLSVGCLDEPLAGLHTPLDTYNVGGLRGFLQIPFEQFERRGITALLIQHLAHQPAQARIDAFRVGIDTFPGDRKSTRLNSSHLGIS